MSDDQQLPPDADEKHDPPAGKTFTFRRSFTFGRRPPPETDVDSIPISSREFKWELGDTSEPVDAEPGRNEKPATYYEALTGKPDPNREFFLTARRGLNLIVTVLAFSIPIGLILLGIVTGADLQTIVFMGIAGLIVGFMIKTSFPRTPFG